MTGIGNFDGEHHERVGYSPQRLTQRVGAADVDTVGTQPLRCGSEVD